MNYEKLRTKESDEYAEGLWEDLTDYQLPIDKQKELCLKILTKLINDGGGDTATRMFYSLGRIYIRDNK